MRPVLFTLQLTLGTCILIVLGAVAATCAFVLRGRPRGIPLGPALLPALKASLATTFTAGVWGGPRLPWAVGPAAKADGAKADGAPTPSGKDGEPAAGDPAGGEILSLGAIGGLVGVLPLLIVLFRGPFVLPVSSYPTTLACAFAAGIGICGRAARRMGIPSAHVLDLAIICLVSGPVGSRVFFVAQFWEEHFADRPARALVVRANGLVAGDVLEVETGKGRARAVFSGKEDGLESLLAPLAALEPAGVKAKVLDQKRRGQGAVVQRVVRGVALETLERGPDAELAVSGTAVVKLGLSPGRTRGRAIPWTETVKLWNGGLVFYGGLLFATVLGVLYVKLRGYRILAIADMIAPVLGLAAAFGRLGCWLNGCCWGREIDPGSSLAVRFPPFSFPWAQHARSVLDASYDALLDRGATGDAVSEPLRAVLEPQLCSGSHAVHPVQLYDVGLELSLFLGLLAFRRFVAKREGQTFFAFFMAYAWIRFSVEHFRGDHGGFVFASVYPLSVSQCVGLAVFPVGLAGFLWTLRRPV